MEGIPSPMGAYPHARRVGNLLYLSGIGPRSGRDDSVPRGTIDHPITGERQEYDVEKQTRQCIQNVELVLKAHDLTLKDCVDVDCFLVDMKREFQTFNDVYAQHFHFPDGTPSPVRTTVQVNELPPGGRIAVELKVVAAFPEGKYNIRAALASGDQTHHQWDTALAVPVAWAFVETLKTEN